jgi:hypothetical protein
MICPHMNPDTGEVCSLYFLHNARHRSADGAEWGGRGPHDMPQTRETDAMWRDWQRAELRKPQGEAVRLFTPAPAQMPGQTYMPLTSYDDPGLF